MSSITLPFPVEEKTENEKESLKEEVYEKLSEPLKEVARNKPHVLDYICMLPISEIGIPEYYPELNRKLGDVRSPNLIYRPTTKTRIFTYSPIPRTTGTAIYP
jgi:flagellar protein FlaI